MTRPMRLLRQCATLLLLASALGFVPGTSAASEPRPRRPAAPRVPTVAAPRLPLAPVTSIRPVGSDGKPMPRVGLHAQAAGLCTPTPLPKGDH